MKNWFDASGSTISGLLVEPTMGMFLKTIAKIVSLAKASSGSPWALFFVAEGFSSYGTKGFILN